MLQGVERLVDLCGPRTVCMEETPSADLVEIVRSADTARLAQTDGHFAAVARDGQTIRLARTIGLPLRYFVAKMFHGPFLVVGERIDEIFEWCRSQKIGWQFDPLYTRMVPAHYLVELDQIGCPDPAPRYRRFFDPPVASGSADIAEAGAAYISASFRAVKRWMAGIPADAPIGVAFSGGIDSTAILILALQAARELGTDASRIRAFTLDLGGGADAAQAQQVVEALGLEDQWEVVRVPEERYRPDEAIRVIEDYHPLDVECAAASLCLLGGIRERYPTLRYLLDGDGGDENLKSYPLEDSDLTISSVLRNPLLYQEGWGVDAIKHSLTYSGGLSRSYVRTYAPARHFGFEAFSPFTVRSVIAAALALPFDAVIDGSVEKLYALKGEVVRAGIQLVAGIQMPGNPKRRFQDGAGGDRYREWRVSKAWCRSVFLRQWDERLREVWGPGAERLSGNAVPA